MNKLQEDVVKSLNYIPNLKTSLLTTKALSQLLSFNLPEWLYLSYANDFLFEKEYVEQMKELTEKERWNIIVPDEVSLKEKYNHSIIIVDENKNLIWNISVDPFKVEGVDLKIVSTGTLFVKDEYKSKKLWSKLIEAWTYIAKLKNDVILSLTFNEKVLYKRLKLGFKEFDVEKIWKTQNPKYMYEYLKHAMEAYRQTYNMPEEEFLSKIKYTAWHRPNLNVKGNFDDN